MKPRPIWRLACLGFLSYITACGLHGECYSLRDTYASGRFGDTAVAVSGNGSDPGTVRIYLREEDRGTVYRNGQITSNIAGVIDTLSLQRFTRVSDPARTPIFSTGVDAYFTPDGPAFDKLFDFLATEDVMFEVVAKNGTVRKARLNLDERNGPKQACDPWT